jgi:Tfp pilus assembly protein PilN
LGDRWVLGAAAVIILLVGAAAYLFWTTRGRLTELEVGIVAAQADSARYVDEIAQSSLLEAREDSILQRATIIQEIDEGRYVWPHILDEIARALPEYTWLTNILQVSLGEELQFRIDGRAGNNFAVTQFMENLEASLFISNVDLISAEQVPESSGGVNRAVTSFSLEAFFDRPPPELLQTVPLFQARAEGGDGPPPGL